MNGNFVTKDQGTGMQTGKSVQRHREKMAVYKSRTKKEQTIQEINMADTSISDIQPQNFEKINRSLSHSVGGTLSWQPQKISANA